MDLRRAEEGNMDRAPLMHERGAYKLWSGETAVAPLSDRWSDGGLAKSAARAAQHAVQCTRVEVTVARGRQHAGSDRALLIQERRGGTRH